MERCADLSSKNSIRKSFWERGGALPIRWISVTCHRRWQWRGEDNESLNRRHEIVLQLSPHTEWTVCSSLLPLPVYRCSCGHPPLPSSTFLGHLVYYDLVQRQTAYRLDDRYSFPRSLLWGIFSFPRVRGSSSRAACARPPTTAPPRCPPIGASQANDGAPHVTRAQWRRRSFQAREVNPLR